MNRKLVATLLAAALGGCETAGVGLGGLGSENYAQGSDIGARLSRGDTAALAAVFTEAVAQGASGKAIAWSGPSATGTVTPGAYLAGNLWPDARKVMPVAGRLDLSQSLETERGLHAVAKTANVRAAPAPDAPVLTTLAPGTPVDVVGKTPGAPWMLLATGGAIRGYAHESLVVKAPGLELELAGGPTKTPWRCREYSQTLFVSGRNDRWSGVACDRGGGWRLVTTAPASAF